MYGTTRTLAVHRLAELLERLRRERLRAADGTTFRVSFSAGVVEYPTDAGDLQSLHAAADQALYAAKAAGRDRVVPAGWVAALAAHLPAGPAPVRPCLIAVGDGDVALGSAAERFSVERLPRPLDPRGALRRIRRALESQPARRRRAPRED